MEKHSNAIPCFRNQVFQWSHPPVYHLNFSEALTWWVIDTCWMDYLSCSQGFVRPRPKFLWYNLASSIVGSCTGHINRRWMNFAPNDVCLHSCSTVHKCEEQGQWPAQSFTLGAVGIRCINSTPCVIVKIKNIPSSCVQARIPGFAFRTEQLGTSAAESTKRLT